MASWLDKARDNMLGFYAGTAEISVSPVLARQLAHLNQLFYCCSGGYNARSTKCIASHLRYPGQSALEYRTGASA